MNAYRIRNNPVPRLDLLSGTGQFQQSRALRVSIVPGPIVRYAYYAFLFSLPIEKASFDILGITLSRVLGVILIGVTIAASLFGKTRLRLTSLSKPFGWFTAYLAIYVALGVHVIVAFGAQPALTEPIIQAIKTFVQLLIVFWISYNLMRYERITKGALVSLATSSIVVAVLQAFGITGDLTTQDRIAAFESNENLIASILSFGLVIVVGLAYGRDKVNLKTFLIVWPSLALLAVMIVVTGSRGAMIALLLALLVFFSYGKTLKAKIKIGVAVVLAIGFLGWASYEIEPVRKRWERTYYEGDTAGRDLIFSEAWEMIVERPILGWGPSNFNLELGYRLGLSTARDPHNIYLWLLGETGILGAVPFLIAVWCCCQAAWKGRYSIQGALPISLLVFLLIRGMTGSAHYDKLFWVGLAYAVAAGSSISLSQRDRLLLVRRRSP